MTIIKDANYWREYNQKRKDYLAQKKRETRERLKMSTTNLQIGMSTTEPLKVVDIIKKEVVVDIPTSKKVVDTQLDNLVVDISKVVGKSEIKQLSEIEKYNELISRRVKTHDPQRFYTFPDGRKIVRTKCGCNPTQDFYDWCKNNCPFFTDWREKAVKLIPLNIKVYQKEKPYQIINNHYA